MENLVEVRDGIVAWARLNGLLVDNFSLEPGFEGNAELCPFSDESVGYFQNSRRIVRATCEGTVLTIFTRQKIAEAKITQLKKEFGKSYQDRSFVLKIEVSSFYRVNQRIGLSIEPIRYYGTGDDRFISCGSSVGIGNQRNAGTLGALATMQGDSETIYGISCNHVLGGCSTSPPDTPIVVPGIQDVSYQHDQIFVVGSHSSAAPMAQGLPTVTNTKQNFDLSYFKLDPAARISSRQGNGDDSYDTPVAFAKPELEMEVKKWGRTTGFTTGTIAAINREFEGIDYDVVSFSGPARSEKFKGTVYFRNLIEIDPLQGGRDGFSTGGDSGSLVVTEDGTKAIGMVIAGAGGKGIVFPLEEALNAVGLTLLADYNW